MATTTPVQNNSALTAVNVAASPSARDGDILSTCQFCRNRIQEYQAGACVAIRKIHP